MDVRNLKQKSVNVHDFAMNPRSPVPRSSFPVRQAKKTAFSAAYLVPIYCEEVLPGDTFNINCSVAARTATPIVPVLDNWHMEFFAFFQPNRISWENWEKMLGAQDNPGDHNNYVVPEVEAPAGGFYIGTLGDYFGLPTQGQMDPAGVLNPGCFPFRAYNEIYNQWFRDENLQNSAYITRGNLGASITQYPLRKRGKRPDYFTMALPWPQKGTQVTLPLGQTAPVVRDEAQPYPWFQAVSDTAARRLQFNAGTTDVTTQTAAVNTGVVAWSIDGPGISTGLLANLNAAVGPTVNLFRQYFATQQFMEKQARGGTRYTEIIQTHFGVRPPDYRLDRPEYIGGGRVPILTNAIPQTSATGLTGGTTPAGSLAATGWAEGRVGFNYSAQEHGYIIMLVNVRADLNYQQGQRRHWSRRTLADFYFPVFANLGEQTILNKEIYARGTSQDDDAFGYIPRWDEYRHFPSEITGIFRSTATGTLDYWHSAQRFTSLPTLNSTFITDDTNTVLQRNFSAGALTEGQQFLCDFLFTGRVARPLPTHSVPGLLRF